MTSRFTLSLLLAASLSASHVQAQCRVQPLPSPGLGEADWHGTAAAISGDTAMFGAIGDDEKGLGAGAVYVYEKTSAGWVVTDKLFASDPGPHDYFGYSIAIDGDFAVIGACWADAPGVDSGAAYVFQRIGGSWVEVQRLLPPDSQRNEFFGYRVAMDGSTAVITAYYGETIAGDYAGAAYVYVELGGVWSFADKLVAGDGEAGDRFGGSVDLDGDRIAVGAWLADDGVGAVYVFDDHGAGWTEAQKISSPDPDDGDSFYAVGLDGDTLFVGAHRDDEAADDAGAFYIYEKGATWSLTQKVVASDAAKADEFGSYIQVDNGIAAVGSLFDDDGAGAIYLYRDDGTAWVETTKVEAADELSHARFGWPLDLHDGRVAVGAPTSSAEVRVAGGAYVFDLNAVPCAAVEAYGCINPPGSLTVTGGPTPGTTITLHVDNPLGNQHADSLAFAVVTDTADPAFPCGTAVPGYGMGAGGAAGEVLVDAGHAPMMFLSATTWTTTSGPAPIPIAIPHDVALIGTMLYAQGALVDTTPGVEVPIGLTEGAEIQIGH